MHLSRCRERSKKNFKNFGLAQKTPARFRPTSVSNICLKHLYWTPGQMRQSQAWFTRRQAEREKAGVNFPEKRGAGKTVAVPISIEPQVKMT